MPAVTVRNLAESTHRALKARAAQHGRSTEAEIRQILDDAVRPRVGLGTQIAEIAREVDGIDLKVRRDRSAVKPVRFD